MRPDGILLVLFASIWFSGGTMLIKAIGPDIPVVWVAFMRNAVAVPLLFFAMKGTKTEFSSPFWFGCGYFLVTSIAGNFSGHEAVISQACRKTASADFASVVLKLSRRRASAGVKAARRRRPEVTAKAVKPKERTTVVGRTSTASFAGSGPAISPVQLRWTDEIS